ncbi:hypothetical protein V8C86DRAFT_2802067 [Haematococcus lacustris]
MNKTCTVRTAGGKLSNELWSIPSRPVLISRECCAGMLLERQGGQGCKAASTGLAQQCLEHGRSRGLEGQVRHAYPHLYTAAQQLPDCGLQRVRDAGHVQVGILGHRLSDKGQPATASQGKLRGQGWWGVLPAAAEAGIDGSVLQAVAPQGQQVRASSCHASHAPRHVQGWRSFGAGQLGLRVDNTLKNNHHRSSQQCKWSTEG